MEHPLVSYGFAMGMTQRVILLANPDTPAHLYVLYIVIECILCMVESNVIGRDKVCIPSISSSISAACHDL